MRYRYRDFDDFVRHVDPSRVDLLPDGDFLNMNRDLLEAIWAGAREMESILRIDDGGTTLGDRPPSVDDERRRRREGTLGLHGTEVQLARNFEGVELLADVRGKCASLLFVEYDLGGCPRPSYPRRSAPLSEDDLDRMIEALTQVRDRLQAASGVGCPVV